MTPRDREHRYDATVTWTGAASGPTRDYAGYSREHLVTIEGKRALTGSADPVFRGDARYHTPEDLLVAALASCHLLAYLALCARARIPVIAYVDRAEGVMSERAGAGHFTRALLRPVVVVERDEDVDRAYALHDTAHAECFIANSVNFPVEHEAVVRGPSRERHAADATPA